MGHEQLQLRPDDASESSQLNGWAALCLPIGCRRTLPGAWHLAGSCSLVPWTTCPTEEVEWGRREVAWRVCCIACQWGIEVRWPEWWYYCVAAAVCEGSPIFQNG